MSILPRKTPENGWIRRKPLQPVPTEGGQLMIGCHKTSDDSEMRGFSSGLFDEPAMWGRELKKTKSLNEILYFTGGSSKHFIIGKDLLFEF